MNEVKESKEVTNLVAKLNQNSGNIMDDLENIIVNRGRMRKQGHWIWYIFPTNRPGNSEIRGDGTAITNREDFYYILRDGNHLRNWYKIFDKINLAMMLPDGYKQAIFIWNKEVNDWGRILIFLKIWDYYYNLTNAKNISHNKKEINDLYKAILIFKENFITTQELKNAYDSINYDGVNLNYNDISKNNLIKAFYNSLITNSDAKERERTINYYKKKVAKAQRDPDAYAAARKRDEEEAARKAAEEEAARKAAEEEKARKAAEEEAARKAAEEEKARKAAEEEKARKAAEEEAARKAAEEEAARLAAAEAARKAAEEEAARKAAEEEAARKAAEEEAARLAADEAARKAAEEEKARKAAEEEAARKAAEEEAAQPQPRPQPQQQVEKNLLIIYGFFLGDIKYYNVTKISEYTNDPNDIFNNDLLIKYKDDINLFYNHFKDKNNDNNIYIKNKSELSTILKIHESSYETFKIINYYVFDDFITYNKISDNKTILEKSIEYINDSIESHTFLIDNIISTDKYYYHMLNNYLILLNLINFDNKKLYLDKFYENIININKIEITDKNNLIFSNLKTIFDIFKDIDDVNEDELKRDDYNKLSAELINKKKIEGKLHINFIDCIHLILKKTNTITKIINIINEYIDNIKNTYSKIFPYKLQISLEKKFGESFFKFLTLILSYFNILKELNHNLWYILYVHNIIIIDNEKNSNYLLLLNYIKYDYYKEIIKNFKEQNIIKNSNFINYIEILGNNINNFKNNYNNNDILKKHQEIDTENKKVIKKFLIEKSGLTINEKKITLSSNINHDQRDISIILNYIFPNFTKGFNDKNKNKNIFKNNFNDDEHMIYDPYFYYKLFSNYNIDEKENNDITIINSNLTNIEKKFNKTIFNGLIAEYTNSYNSSVSLSVIQPITRIAIFLELFNIDYKDTNTSIINSYDYIRNNIDTYSKNRSDYNGSRFFNIDNTIIKWRPIIKNIIDFFKLKNENNKIITYFDLIQKIIAKVVIRNKPHLKIGDADNDLKINYIIKDNNNNYILDLNNETTKNNSDIIKYIPLDNLSLDPKYYKIIKIILQTDKKVSVKLRYIDIINKLNETYNKIKIKFKNENENENIEATFLLVPFEFDIDLFKGLKYDLYINIENFNDDNMFILCYKDENNSYLLKYYNNNLYFIFKKTEDHYYHYNPYNDTIIKKYYVDYADIILDEELLMKNIIYKKIKSFIALKNKINDINKNDKFDENILEYYVKKLKYNKDFITKINKNIYEQYKNALTNASNACDDIIQLNDNYNKMLKEIYNDSTLNNSYIEELKKNYNNYLIKINEIYLKLDLRQHYNDDYLEETKKKFIDKLHRAVTYTENSNTDFQESNSYIVPSPSEQNYFIEKFNEHDKKNEYKLELEKFLKYANQHEHYIIKIEKLIKDINKYHKLSRDITKNIEHKKIYQSDLNNNFKIHLKENLFNYEKMIDNYKKFTRILNENINKLHTLIHDLNNNKNEINNINIDIFTSTKTNYDNYYNLFTKYMKANDYIIDYYNIINMFKNVYDVIIKSLANNKFIIKFNKKNYEIIILLKTINKKILEYNKILDNSYSNELLGIAPPNKDDFDKYLEFVKKYLLNIQNIDNYHESSYITEELKNIIKDTNDQNIQYNIIKETFKNRLKDRFKTKKDIIENTFKLLKYNNIEQHNIRNIEKFIDWLNTLSFDKKIKAIEKYVFEKRVTDKQYNYLIQILSEKNVTLSSIINYYKSNI